MNWDENPKCTHIFTLQINPKLGRSSICFKLAFIWSFDDFLVYSFDFPNQNLKFFRFKIISNLTMIYYYQNMIRRTIGLIVDIFTKHLPSSHFLALQAKLSIVPHLVSLQGMITLTTNSRIKLTYTRE